MSDNRVVTETSERCAESPERAAFPSRRLVLTGLGALALGALGAAAPAEPAFAALEPAVGAERHGKSHRGGHTHHHRHTHHRHGHH